jgi:putative aldouronate transport system permease protein
MVTAEAGKTNEQDLYRQLVKYSTVIVATLPILCIYPFVQKYFVKGFMIGSVKG